MNYQHVGKNLTHGTFDNFEAVQKAYVFVNN